ncbi:hypothetical protein A2U01_0069966, partial [Trifolium medium]|nr:hypothetical protein [Trifolium medium]
LRIEYNGVNAKAVSNAPAFADIAPADI